MSVSYPGADTIWMLSLFLLKRTHSLALSAVALNFDPFDFLERKFLAGVIVGVLAWRFVVPDGLGVSSCAIIPPQRFSRRKQRKKASLAVLDGRITRGPFPVGPYSNFSQGCSRRPTRSIANAWMDVGVFLHQSVQHSISTPWDSISAASCAAGKMKRYWPHSEPAGESRDDE
jgi:hypothetical protein